MDEIAKTVERKAGTQRQEDFEQTRRELLWAALTILAREGESGVTMVAVAKQAKRSRGTVYHHFANREEMLRLMHASIADQLGQISSGQRRPVDPFAFASQVAGAAPEIMRMESLRLLQAGTSDPHIVNLVSWMKDDRDGEDLGIPIDPDVDIEAAATLLITASRIASDIYLSGVSGEKERKIAATRFAGALRRLIFNGLIDEEKHREWSKRFQGES